MKPVCRTIFTRSRMPSLILCCALAAVACDKKEETDTLNSSDTNVDVADKQATNNDLGDPIAETDISHNTNTINNTDGKRTDTVVTPPIERMPVILCDDQLALTQLIQTVRASINSQSQQMLEHYIDRTDIVVGAADTHASVSAMLVDVAKPKQISAANSNGLITCNASLSLTLPTKDIYRAQDVYRALDGDSLNKRLQAQKVSMNNNMLVSNTFTYVVGIQSGQTITRMVGQPAILVAVADIIAKSQFKAAVDAVQPKADDEPSNDAVVNNANKANKVAIERPAQPAQSAQPTQPSSPATVTNPDAVKPKQSDTANKAIPHAQSKPSANSNASTNPPKSQRLGADDVSNAKESEIVISQEEGTY